MPIIETFPGSLAEAATNPAPPIERYAGPADPTAVVVIFPGGGYGGLADHEGADYAEFLAEQGFACFVVRYRLGSAGHRHPCMLEDALAAIATIRREAERLGVAGRPVGVMGSSAGGHLAAHSAVAWARHPVGAAARPDFAILCYPVIDMLGLHAHSGSRRNLLGDEASPELSEEVHPPAHVDARTPPCFLWHTGEDAAVPLENSLLFAAALREQGVPFELHLYPRGRHGLGLGADVPWGISCARWLRSVVQDLADEATVATCP